MPPTLSGYKGFVYKYVKGCTTPTCNEKSRIITGDIDNYYPAKDYQIFYSPYVKDSSKFIELLHRDIFVTNPAKG